MVVKFSLVITTQHSINTLWYIISFVCFNRNCTLFTINVHQSVCFEIPHLIIPITLDPNTILINVHFFFKSNSYYISVYCLFYERKRFVITQDSSDKNIVPSYLCDSLHNILLCDVGTCFLQIFNFINSLKLLVKMFVVFRNTLRTLRTVSFEYRWHLLSSIAAISLGYVVGFYYVNYVKKQDDRKSVGTDLMTIDTIQHLAEFYRKIQLKIDQIAGNVIA